MSIGRRRRRHGRRLRRQRADGLAERLLELRQSGVPAARRLLLLLLLGLNLATGAGHRGDRHLPREAYVAVLEVLQRQYAPLARHYARAHLVHRKSR